MRHSATAFAPASVGNVGIGFDILGHTIEAIGDTVHVERTKELGVRIKAITGVATELPLEAAKNTAGQALKSLAEEIYRPVRTYLEHHESVHGRLDYVLVDCPPSLNLLTINAMAAAHAILVPLQCEFFALEGLSQLLSTVEQVRKTLNGKLTIHGVVLTMFDPRNNLATQVVEDVRAYMGEKVYKTIIPRNVRVSEAPSHGKPVLLYDLKCTGSQAYLKLASEVIQREHTLRVA